MFLGRILGILSNYSVKAEYSVVLFGRTFRPKPVSVGLYQSEFHIQTASGEMNDHFLNNPSLAIDESLHFEATLCPFNGKHNAMFVLPTQKK